MILSRHITKRIFSFVNFLRIGIHSLHLSGLLPIVQAFPVSSILFKIDISYVINETKLKSLVVRISFFHICQSLNIFLILSLTCLLLFDVLIIDHLSLFVNPFLIFFYIFLLFIKIILIVYNYLEYLHTFFRFSVLNPRII